MINHAVFAASLAFITSHAFSADLKPLTLYGVEFTRSSTQLQIANETYKTIERAIYPRKLIVQTVSLKEFEGILADNKADIVITNSGIYRRHILNGWRDIVTLVTKMQPDPDHAIGSLILSRKGSGIRSLAELKDKTIALNAPTAFQGTLTIKKELLDKKYDPNNFFSSIGYLGTDAGKRLDAVKSGVYDSTFVSSCYLERLKQKEGRDLTREFDLVEPKTQTGSLCLTSTELYPNYTLLTSPNLNPGLIRSIAEALLKLPPNSQGEYWSFASDYRQVDNMYRAIKSGPYEHLNNWTVKRIWQEFKMLIVILFFTVFFAVWHIWRTGQMVTRATNEIIEFTEIQKKNIQKHESIKSALTVSGLSSVVAHELGQPLAASMFFASSLKKLIKRLEIKSDPMQEAVDGLLEQTQKANDIVKLVQNYSKTRGGLQGRAYVNHTINKVVTVFCKEHPDSRDFFILDLKTGDAEVEIPPIEFELVISNLIRNSYQACLHRETPLINISTKQLVDKVEITVKDNSGSMTSEKFSRLDSPFPSDKVEGLGLGLTIVKSILLRRCSSIRFFRDGHDCLTCKITVPVIV